MKIKQFLILLVFIILLSACAMEEPSVAEFVHQTHTAAAIKPSTTAFQTLTNTLTPSVTPSITLTATNTLTPTASLTPTFTATPFKGFESASFNGVQYDTNAVYLIFNVPNVSQSYSLHVQGQVLQCSPSQSYANTLVCEGTNYSPDYGSLGCDFYTVEGETEKLLYSGYFYYAQPATATPPPPPWVVNWDGSHDCPQRGENVSCETEYRLIGGVPCMIASCFDLCGHYYSIDNCTGLTGEIVFTGRHSGPGWDPLEAVR